MAQVRINKEQKLVENVIEPSPGIRLPAYPSREVAMKYLVE